MSDDNLPGDRETITTAGRVRVGPGSTSVPHDPRFVAVGEGSTELIPRLWAERILGELRSSKPAVWRSLVGKASAAPAAPAGGS